MQWVSLNHARLFFQSIVLQVLLIFLLRVRFGLFNKTFTGVLMACLLSAFLALLQEGLQLFIPSRTPSPTDIYCFTAGGAMGLWLKFEGSNKSFEN